MTVLIVGAGSCIIEAIIKHLREIPGIGERAELFLSQIVATGRPDVPDELLARCTILIEEAAPWQGSGTLTERERTLLAESCTRITVPTLHFNSLWPLMTEDPRNVPEPGAPYGRIPFPMGDRLALRIMETVPDPAARRAAYDATDLGTVVNLARSHELEVRNCFAREQGCDVRIAAFLMSQFRDRRLFYTHAHPTGEMLLFVLAQLFAIPALRDVIGLPYDRLVAGARAWAAGSNVFAGEEAPIHPAVARHFGLNWWRPDYKYGWMGQKRTFGEWIDWYLTYQPGQADPGHAAAAAPAPAPAPAAVPAPAVATSRALRVGPWLDGLIRQRRTGPSAVLMPPEIINRVPFEVTGPIEEGVAAFGRYLNDPSFRQYRAVASLVACLPEASVVGCEGAVVFRGEVLQDTMRNMTAGPDAPAVRSASGDGIVLQEGVKARRLQGSYMVGHSGMWRNYAHWLCEALPRLVTFKRLRAQMPGLKLLLPPLVPGSFQAQTLDLLGIEPEWLETEAADEVLTCEKLFSTSVLDLWSFPPYCRQAAAWLGAAAEAKAAGPGLGPVVYIHRGAAVRRVRDFDVLSGLLQSRGVHIADFQGMRLTEQIAAMRQARLVIGEHGSGLANIMFCRPGTTVIDLFNPAAVQPAYWSIASCCGLRYGYMVGRHVRTDAEPEPQWNSDYELDAPALLAAIDGLLAGS